MSRTKKFILISFSVACIIAIITCVIVNIAIDKKVTWATYPILSVPFGWLLFTPLLIKKHGITLSLCSLTIISIPFLFLLEKITPVHGWFIPLGIPSAIVGVPVIWVIYILFRFLKISAWYKTSLTVFLGGVLANVVIGYFIDMHLSAKPISLDTILSAAACLVASVAIFIIGYKKNKARNITE